MKLKPHIKKSFILQNQYLGNFIIVSHSDIVSDDDKQYKYIIEIIDKLSQHSILFISMEQEKNDNYHIVMYKNEKSKRLYGVGDVDYEFFITDARNILIDNVPEFSNPVWIENQRSEHHEFINNVFFGF